MWQKVTGKKFGIGEEFLFQYGAILLLPGSVKFYTVTCKPTLMFDIFPRVTLVTSVFTQTAARMCWPRPSMYRPTEVAVLVQQPSLG